MKRPDWNTYFKQLTTLVASRSTCIRRKCGAIIVKNKRIISSGYNGPPPGFDHCTKETCIRTVKNIPSGERHEICYAVHAEMNAIIQAAIHGVSVKNCDIYINTTPCSICARMLISINTKNIYFWNAEYPDGFAKELLEKANIPLHKI